MAHTYDLVSATPMPTPWPSAASSSRTTRTTRPRCSRPAGPSPTCWPTWGDYLQQTNPGADKIEEYFAALAAERAACGAADGQPANPVLGALHLKLADKYQATNDNVKALEQYELAAKQGDADTSASARAAHDKLQARVAEMPVESARLRQGRRGKRPGRRHPGRPTPTRAAASPSPTASWP